MGMPQGTGPEQLDLAVQADERTLQGGGTLEQNGRGQGTVTWNVLPTELCFKIDVPKSTLRTTSRLGAVLGR